MMEHKLQWSVFTSVEWSKEAIIGNANVTLHIVSKFNVQT